MKWTIVILLSLFSNLLFAQIVNLQGRPAGQLITDKNTSSDILIGSPYVREGFESGYVVDYEGNKNEALIRFNSNSNEFEVYRDQGPIIIQKFVYEKVVIEYFDEELFKKKTLVFRNKLDIKGFDKDHYFQILFESEGMMILKDYENEMIESKVTEYGGGFYTKRNFKQSERYYYVKNGGEPIELKRTKGDIIGNFKEIKNEIKEFIKTNDIKLESDGEMVKLLTFIHDTLS
ncbi:MAG: hypothetical protein RIF46_15300 [Cyclobacteriaceae bacterium]